MRTRYRYNAHTDQVEEVRAGHNGGPPLEPQASSAFVISDTMEPMVHPCNGKIYDSKARFRAETRARGCTEVGNETIPCRVDRSLPGNLREDIARAYDEAASRS